MENDKAIAVSAAMVAVAAIASGAFVFASQAGASDPSVPNPPSAEIVVEYVDADGNIIPIETTTASAADPLVAAIANAPVSDVEPAGYGEYDHDEEEHDEYEDEDEDHDEYEHEDHDEYEHEDHDEYDGGDHDD